MPRRAAAGTVPFSIASSYVLPVRLSVTESVSRPAPRSLVAIRPAGAS